MTKQVQTRPSGRSGIAAAVTMVVLTGLAGAAGMAANYRMEPIDWALLALIVVLTVGGAIALVRLIRRNPGAIGEARFDTTSPGDRP
ncbi:MAG TPA: hypothetical protein VFL92_07660 [Sphingomonas sp.]|nr:hypothetical protein [Sphingomonas sp.]